MKEGSLNRKSEYNSNELCSLSSTESYKDQLQWWQDECESKRELKLKLCDFVGVMYNVSEMNTKNTHIYRLNSKRKTCCDETGEPKLKRKKVMNTSTPKSSQQFREQEHVPELGSPIGSEINSSGPEDFSGRNGSPTGVSLELDRCVMTPPSIVTESQEERRVVHDVDRLISVAVQRNIIKRTASLPNLTLSVSLNTMFRPFPARMNTLDGSGVGNNNNSRRSRSLTDLMFRLNIDDWSQGDIGVPNVDEQIEDVHTYAQENSTPDVGVQNTDTPEPLVVDTSTPGVVIENTDTPEPHGTNNVEAGSINTSVVENNVVNKVVENIDTPEPSTPVVVFENTNIPEPHGINTSTPVVVLENTNTPEPHGMNTSTPVVVVENTNAKNVGAGVLILGLNASPNILDQPATPGGRPDKRRMIGSPNDQDRARKYSITEDASPQLREPRTRIHSVQVVSRDRVGEIMCTPRSRSSSTPRAPLTVRRRRARTTSIKVDPAQRLISSMFVEKKTMGGDKFEASGR